MKKIFIFLILLSVTTPAYALRHWNKLVYSPEIKNGVKLYTEIEYRYNGNDVFYRHYDGGFRFPIKYFGEGWEGGVQFRAVYTKSTDGSWDFEKRPHAQLQKTIYSPQYEFIPELKWQFRTRHEYRVRENGNDTARNRLRIMLKTKDAYYNIKPFIGNETFYDFDADDWTSNRFILGVDLPEFKIAKPSIAYQLETDMKDNDFDHTSNLLFTLSF
ncbi:MAG: hypothetical protein COV35_08615 [Alphaproteobacteria bacterium CG11_big_fil_rev_8_21_14_0_20_39_49]|nr:MAG: hypothetical protein COV35_08615 [Alphaproteobacteria bacterium CG11_big_fil_rev_8_21_14_0_20_39_49]